jgi:hypothetical protein
MQEFRQRLLHDGYNSFPLNYQMVINTEVNNILPFKVSMEAYKVTAR